MDDMRSVCRLPANPLGNLQALLSSKPPTRRISGTLAMLFDPRAFVTLDRDFQRYEQAGLNLQILISS
jgi:hypothetical protein